MKNLILSLSLFFVTIGAAAELQNIQNLNDIRLVFSTEKNISGAKFDMIYNILEQESKKKGLSAGDIHARMQIITQYYLRGDMGGDGAIEWVMNLIENNKESMEKFVKELKAKKKQTDLEKSMLNLYELAQKSLQRDGNG